MSDGSQQRSPQIDQFREILARAVEAAESEGASGNLQELLRQMSRQIASSSGPPSSGTTIRHDGAMDYTFEDESCEPYGRQIEVRIYYEWDEYDSSDASPTSWPRVADIEVLAVRYLDEHGNAVPIGEHHLDLAWNLVEANRELIVAKCMAEGGSRSSSPPADLQMAPSARERLPSARRRKHG